MQRTTVVCMVLAATLGIVCAGNASEAAASSVISETKAVRYDGYTFHAPAGWPVYRLGPGSTTCVRYNRHAVYLGTPGRNQRCPAQAIGQTGTVSIAPPAATPSVERQRAEVGGQAGPRAVRRPALSVTATYGRDRGMVRRILRSIRSTRTGSPVAVHQMALAPSPNPAGTASPSPNPAGTASQKTRTSRAIRVSAGAGATVPPAATAPAVTPSGPATNHLTSVLSRPLAGFDTCTAPSLKAMKAWRHSYSAAAIYIGGQEMACGYGNLSASWVRSVRDMGWKLIPIYVGLQAPCDSFNRKINAKHSTSEGRAAANSAIADAQGFGIGRGAPLYFDMEAYNGGSKKCRDSVLSFLSQWTRRLHTRHYVSGVYSSASSGAEDLGNATSVDGRKVVKPDSMWFALWNNKANLDGTPYLLGSWWNPNRRIKQYKGGHNAKVGGIKLNIDSDVVQGAVY
jgi:hypothetical protein